MTHATAVSLAATDSSTGRDQSNFPDLYFDLRIQYTQRCQSRRVFNCNSVAFSLSVIIFGQPERKGSIRAYHRELDDTPDIITQHADNRYK
jgi:hypothetical protein